MRIKSLIAFLLLFTMCLALIGCDNGKKPAVTTPKAADTTATPATAAPTVTTAKKVTTTAKPTTTAAPKDTTAPPITTAIGGLVEIDAARLVNLMPPELPDASKYTFQRPMCLDLEYEGYSIAGNSSSSTVFVDESKGAIYGKAVQFNAVNASDPAKRGEITITTYTPFDPIGARGIMFYVDFSDVEKSETADAKQCASVTMNTNNYRSNIAANGSKGYYYENGAWVETFNVTSCRMAIPDGFKGWIYVPATSFIQTSDSTPISDANNKFISISIENMRCYTDGYKYSATDNIIFDEITFIY